MTRNSSILVVDDDPCVLRGTGKILRDAGYRVLEAESASEASGILNKEKPDLVLLDVVLGDVNGVEFCAKVKADARFDGTLIVLSSGVRTASDEQALGLEHGADGYISRPCPNRELLARVESYLRIKRAEDRARESERKLSTLLGNLPGIAYRCKNNKCWSMEFISMGCLELTGYSPEDLIGDRRRTYGDLIHPEDKERVWETVQEAILSESRFELEYRILRADGTERWVREIGVLVDGTEQTPRMLEGFISDITQRRLAEAELRGIEWMLGGQASGEPPDSQADQPEYGDLIKLNTARLILDAVGGDTLRQMVQDCMDLLETSVAVYERNGDYAFGLFVSGWCQHMDLASRRLCVSSDNGVALASGQWLCHECCWNESAMPAMERGEAVDIECVGGIRLYSVPIRAGAEIVGSINLGYGDPPQDPDRLAELAQEFHTSRAELESAAKAYRSRPRFIIELAKRRLHSVALLIGESVERHRTQRALEASEERYRLIMDNTVDVIWTMDGNLRFTYVNKSCLSVTGFSPEEWVGSSLQDHATPERMAEMAGFAMAEFQKPPGGPGVLFESAMLHKDGHEIPVEVHGRVIYDEVGRPVGFQGVTRDISEQKQADEARERLEQQLRQAQRMEAVGQLAGGVAHDFNNILQALLTRTTFLLDGVTPEDDAYEDLMGIMKGTERAADLVRQLLAFSRRQVLELKALDMNEVVGDCLKMLRRVIGEDVELDFISGKSLGLIQADRAQLDQVLMNLCVNARDAMPDGGTITIETQNVTINGEYTKTHSWSSEGRFVLLMVSDTGIGMDAETQKHIFDPFFTTKEVGKGTGLGLATVYGIVAQHDGMVQVYSEPGKGTLFKLYFPMAEQKAVDVGRQVLAKPVGGSETILFAEDDSMVREMTERVLKRAGYTVLTAVDGEEAIEVFETHGHDIDLAILDVVMPRKGGRQTYDHIKASRPEVRVLFSSGYSENAIHSRFVLFEDMELIQKPYEPAALLRRVREVLDG